MIICSIYCLKNHTYFLKSDILSQTVYIIKNYLRFLHKIRIFAS